MTRGVHTNKTAIRGANGRFSPNPTRKRGRPPKAQEPIKTVGQEIEEKQQLEKEKEEKKEAPIKERTPKTPKKEKNHRPSGLKEFFDWFLYGKIKT
jgi:hypothetical protein